MRLEALQMEPGMFCSNYAFEMNMGDAAWLNRLTDPGRATFGLFYHNEPVGITAIATIKDKPGTADMIQSYIRKEHRGKGLSRLLYDARLEWAKQHELKQLVIGHRKNNITSKAANQHYGFRYTHSEPRTWPDGTTEDILYYVLEL